MNDMRKLMETLDQINEKYDHTDHAHELAREVEELARDCATLCDNTQGKGKHNAWYEKANEHLRQAADALEMGLQGYDHE